MRRSVLAVLTLLAASMFAKPCLAYEIATLRSDACHEWITIEAMRRTVAAGNYAEPRGAITRDDRALLKDLPFELPDDVPAFSTAVMTLTGRENDLGGSAPNDLTRLAQVHGAAANQKKHCLRRPGDDEPDGSAHALQRCRHYIRERMQAALDDVSDTGLVDLAQRSKQQIYLLLRGSLKAPLPTTYVELGHALHALQDGFSHAIRDPDDHRKLISLLNYTDDIEERLDARVDGPAHVSAMDECHGLDDFQHERIALAIEASADLIAAVTVGGESRDERERRISDVFDEYMTLEPGACRASNDWCDARELSYPAPEVLFCSVGWEEDSRAGTQWAGILSLVALCFLRRRRRAFTRASSCLARRSGALGIVALPTMLYSVDVGAQNATLTSTAPVGDTSTASYGPSDLHSYGPTRTSPWGLELAAGGALQNAALAGSAGIRYRLSRQWLVGLDGEYNPWASFAGEIVRAGSTNVYVTGVFRMPLQFQRVNLRSTLQLGASRMNFDLVGVPKGTIGPFFGFNLLGVDIELAKTIYLVINPAHIAVPWPQADGVPFAYPQYRLTVALQLGA